MYFVVVAVAAASLVLVGAAVLGTVRRRRTSPAPVSPAHPYVDPYADPVTVPVRRPGRDLTGALALPVPARTAAFPDRGDMDVAREAAETAAAWLLDLRDDPQERALAARGAALAGGVVTGILREARPDAAIVSAYATDETRTGDQVWIVEALDGAESFAAAGGTEWAVQVALWQDGDLAGGVVALPALDMLVASDALGPAYAVAEMTGPDPRGGRNGEPNGPMLVAVARARPQAAVWDLADRMGARLVPLGSVGYAILAVVAGEMDVYVHLGEAREWDSAAAVAIARAAGMHVSRIDGSRVHYNRSDPSLPDLLVCRPGVSARVHATLAQMLSEAAELAAADAPTRALPLVGSSVPS